MFSNLIHYLYLSFYLRNTLMRAYFFLGGGFTILEKLSLSFNFKNPDWAL